MSDSFRHILETIPGVLHQVWAEDQSKIEKVPRGIQGEKSCKDIVSSMCPFDYTAVAGSGKVGPVNQVNHTSWVAVVTPTDRPKSVRNRCLIELFCGVVCVVTALLTFPWV